MSTFEFNAPQFIDFAHLDDPQADRFFGELCDQPTNHETENVKPVDDSQKDLVQSLEKLQISDIKEKRNRAPLRVTQRFDGLLIESQEPKPHPMTTRLDSILKTPVLKLRSRSVIKQQNIEDDEEEKEKEETKCTEEKITNQNIKVNQAIPAVGYSLGVKRLASPLTSARKFISLAEQIQHFQKDTPDRFRTKPKKAYKPSSLPKLSCNPKTPNLTAKSRHRPVNFPDQKEREEMELAEMKKHQIKAHPLNEKILKGPSLNLKFPVEKRPSTVPAPFPLTEVRKKETPAEEVFQFKAQPVPVNILQKPVGIPPKKILLPTTPHTPQIKLPSRYRCPIKTPEKINCSDISDLPRNTRIQPFSFDERMKILLQKKEETIKKIIEEEKRTFNSFKAQPMPSYRENCRQSKPIRTPVPTKVQPFNLTQPRSAQKKLNYEEEKPPTPFKAQPATVIHKKPFEPKLSRPETPVLDDFKLNTEKRALERKKFDEKIKQKEEEYSLILKQEKEKEEDLERQKKLEERKLCEFKANPMPRYKPFEIHAADPSNLTMPKSPVFLSGKSKISKKD